MTVIDTCRIAMRHMDISGSAASQEATRGVVALNCSKHTAYDISIGSGIDAASPPVLASISGLGDGATQMIPVYSKVPARISEANGVSTRVLTMTITY